MSKYTELCQSFAIARQASQQAMRSCDEFINLFLTTMGDYLGCPVELQNFTVDEQGSIHFYPAIKLYANPAEPDEDAAEIIVVSAALEPLEDGFLVTLFPWDEGFEIINEQLHNPDHFIPIYDFICEQIQQAYASLLITPPLDKVSVRNLGWDFYGKSL